MTLGNPVRNPVASRRRVAQGRRGATLVLAAFLMVVMFAMLAFSVDTGYILNSRTEIQRAVDAAALAGAGAMADGQEEAQSSALEYLVRNPVGSWSAFPDNELAAKIAEFKLKHPDDFEVELGTWNATTKQFTATSDTPTTIRVFYELPNQALFFGPVLGRDSFSIQAESIATYQPRDIMLVLDLSASMNDDSEFGAIGTFSQADVEAGLSTMYGELGSPVYGTLTFTPGWAKIPGAAPQNSSQPQIHVEYRYKSVYVTSTKTLTSVKLEFSNGNTQTINGSGTSGTFQGSGSNNNKQIVKAWVKSGSNGNNGELFDLSSSSAIRTAVKKAFGLTNLAYPNASGSWNAYIDHCVATNTESYSAGYHWKFGHMNLINFWLEDYPSAAQSPNLWKCSAQPISSLKDAVAVFLDYLRDKEADDKVGLAVYNAPDGEGKLESGLVLNYDPVETTVVHTQAGHYHEYTNIGAGLHKGRLELESNARPGALRMIVLMTDGLANWRNGQVNASSAKQYVLDEANLCKQAKIPVLTISLGSGADTSIMQQVADLTNGTHFNVPGGQSVAGYSEALIEVFRQIAASRPLKIVQ